MIIFRHAFQALDTLRYRHALGLRTRLRLGTRFAKDTLRFQHGVFKMNLKSERKLSRARMASPKA